MRAIRPCVNPIGNITARMRAYVGLQLLNTGPKANPISIYFRFPFFSVLLFKSLLEPSEKPSLVERVFQRFGKRVIIPSPMISPPEKLFQKLEGTQIKRVEALRSKEKTSIEILREAMIM